MKKISRRDFLKASAATSGGALLTACGSSGSSTDSTGKIRRDTGYCQYGGISCV